MNDPSITREDVRGRARVDALAPADPREALKVARAIRHPWYRCQSLAKVAEHWGTKQQRMAVLIEALESAQTQSEINRVVTVSAWPLRVMAPLEEGTAAIHLVRLVKLADNEPHSLRRADALSAIAHSVQGRPSLLMLVVPSLVRALLQGYGWRIDRLTQWNAEIVQGTMPEVLEQLVAHHSEGRKKQLLVASLAKARRAD